VAKINLDITLNEIAYGELERRGLEIVGGDADLYGYPWAPKIYVQAIKRGLVQENHQAERGDKSEG